MMACISTGDESFDSALYGGFPKGSLIIIAGNPGVGKSIFSAQFIYRGVTGEGENGVYVSFIENRETLWRICMFWVSVLKGWRRLVVSFEERNLPNDYKKYVEIEEELRRENDQPILRVTGAKMQTGMLYPIISGRLRLQRSASLTLL